MTLWQPVEWFIRVFNMVIGIEFFPGLSLGTISLGFLTIVLIFRMIIYPLTGGSVLSVHRNSSRNVRKRERSDRGDF